MSKEKLQSQAVQTTGHAWDGDLQEYNNPLPRWWVWAFYATILFAIGYWLYYPAWPVAKSFTTGFGKVSYVDDKQQTQTTHWNTRADLLVELDKEVTSKQKPYFDKIATLPYDQIAKDPALNTFIVSAGKQLFSDNCATCHQAGGAGKVGFFPNLADDDWLYGGSFEKIQESITIGRHGYMPEFGEAFTSAQIDQLANYVLSLSGEPMDAAKVAAGKEIFQGETGGCYYCHNKDAKGRAEIGAANLTDKIWLWANVAGAPSAQKKVDAVADVIRKGQYRGVMPAWGQRLKPEQIKVLTVYVHELGGGK